MRSLGECLVKAHDAKGKKSGKEERITLGDVVVPRVTAIEDGERLGQIEVKEAEWGEGPLAIKETVDKSRKCKDEASKVKC